MKKSNLNLQQISNVRILTRRELKKIMGGLEETSGSIDETGSPCSSPCKGGQICCKPYNTDSYICLDKISCVVDRGGEPL